MLTGWTNTQVFTWVFALGDFNAVSAFSSATSLSLAAAAALTFVAVASSAAASAFFAAMRAHISSHLGR